MAGKDNDKLNDEREWASMCFTCHRWVHDNDAEARKLGLIKSRL